MGLRNDLEEKFNEDTIGGVSKDNFLKIIELLLINKCDFIEDFVNDYFDLFLIDYGEFVKKYEKLNLKYNNKFFKLASEDMDYLEEFYNDI